MTTPTDIKRLLAKDENGLLPCSLCYHKASCVSLGEYHDDEQNEREDFVIGCDLCHAVFPPAPTRTSATEAWNTRPYIPVLRALLDDMMKMREVLVLLNDNVAAASLVRNKRGIEIRATVNEILALTDAYADMSKGVE